MCARNSATVISLAATIFVLGVVWFVIVKSLGLAIVQDSARDRYVKARRASLVAYYKQSAVAWSRDGQIDRARQCDEAAQVYLNAPDWQIS